MKAYDAKLNRYVEVPEAALPEPDGIAAELDQWQGAGWGYVRLDDGRRAFMHRKALYGVIAYHDAGTNLWGYTFYVEVEETSRGLRVSKVNGVREQGQS